MGQLFLRMVQFLLLMDGLPGGWFSHEHAPAIPAIAIGFTKKCTKIHLFPVRVGPLSGPLPIRGLNVGLT